MGDGRKFKFTKFQVMVSIGVIAVIIIGAAIAVLFFNNNTKESNAIGNSNENNVLSNVENTLSDYTSSRNEDLSDYELTINCRNDKSVKISGKDIKLKNVIDVKKVNNDSSDNSIAAEMIEFTKYEVTNKLSYDAEALKKAYDSLEVFSAENMVEPKNASIKKENGKYVIEKDVLGSKIDKDKLYSLVESSIKSKKTSIDVEKSKCYIDPQFTAESDKVIKAKNDLEKFSKVNVTYNVRNHTENLDSSTIESWLSIDDNFNVVISDSNAASFVQGLANKYDDVKYGTTFNTTNRGAIQVSGQAYGWQINVSAETNALFEVIRAGENSNREPVYALKGTSASDNGIGNCYVEVDLTNQKLWMYINGNLIVQSDIVTGDASGKIPGAQTPSGVYHINSMTRNTNLVGPGYVTPVAYWMPFNGGIGLHDATWRDEFGGEIYKTEGKGGSHGCVNLPLDVAGTIFNNAYVGLPVVCYN